MSCMSSGAAGAHLQQMCRTAPPCLCCCCAGRLHGPGRGRRPGRAADVASPGCMCRRSSCSSPPRRSPRDPARWACAGALRCCARRAWPCRACLLAAAPARTKSRLCCCCAGRLCTPGCAVAAAGSDSDCQSRQQPSAQQPPAQQQPAPPQPPAQQHQPPAQHQLPDPLGADDKRGLREAAVVIGQVVTRLQHIAQHPGTAPAR